MRIGALTPVRLASERLPGKALMEICGRPMIYHLLDRMTASRHIKDKADVVVCTTEESTDDALVEAVGRYGCSTFRGSTDDIIKRFGEAIEHFGFDAVSQADGDDPLSAPEYLDLTMDRLLADEDIDVVTSDNLPLGCNVKSFTADAMRKVLAAYRSDQNDTGFADYFTKSGICRHEIIQPIHPSHTHGTARLTLDYDVDFELFRRIFEALFREGEIFGTAQIVDLLNKNADWVEINRHVEEEYWSRHSAKSVLEFVDGTGTLRRIGS